MNQPLTRAGSTPNPPKRDYSSLPIAPGVRGDELLRAAITSLWNAFGLPSPSSSASSPSSVSSPTRSLPPSIPHPSPYSWVGFYFGPGESFDGIRAKTGEMILGPREPKPACSPISLQGACGRAFLSGRPLVVRDVKALGENYIACDPRDRSEVVIPIFDANGRITSVLDVDSFDVGAFTDDDAIGLVLAMRRWGICRSTGDIAVDSVG